MFWKKPFFNLLSQKKIFLNVKNSYLPNTNLDFDCGEMQFNDFEDFGYGDSTRHYKVSYYWQFALNSGKNESEFNQHNPWFWLWWDVGQWLQWLLYNPVGDFDCGD